MTPVAAIGVALAQSRAATVPDAELITALEHALECLHDMDKLLRYIRGVLPSREPELYKLITRQLVRGCATSNPPPPPPKEPNE